MFYLCDANGRSCVTKLSFGPGAEFTFIMEADRVPVLFDNEYAACFALGLINASHLHSNLTVKPTQKVSVRRISVSQDA